MSDEVTVIRGLTEAPPPAGLNADQQAIWRIFEEQKLHALRKNADYGSSVFKAPVMKPGMPAGDAILVRMSDKIHRLQALSGRAELVADEALLDTMCDLGTYAFLYAIHAGRVGKEPWCTCKGDHECEGHRA